MNANYLVIIGLEVGFQFHLKYNNYFVVKNVNNVQLLQLRIDNLNQGFM